MYIHCMCLYYAYTLYVFVLCMPESKVVSDSLPFSSILQCVLTRPLAWCVQCVALFVRCQIEKKRSRKAERAMLQLEELTKAYSMNKVPYYIDHACLSMSMLPCLG